MLLLKFSLFCVEFQCNSVLQAPLNTPVTEDKFALLTEKRRISVPLLPGMNKTLTLTDFCLPPAHESGRQTHLAFSHHISYQDTTT